MGQKLVIVLDERDDLVFQVRHRPEVAAAEQLADQCAEPDFDLVQPGCVRRREKEDNPFAGRGEKSLPLLAGLDGRQRAPAKFGHRPAGLFMPVRVEVVEDEVNLLGTGVFAADGRDEVRKDVRRAIRCEVAIDLTRGHLQTGSEAARAVPNVLVLDALDASRLGWLMGMFAFQRLNAGLLVDREDDFAAFEQCLSIEVEIDDVQHLGLEVRIRTVQPVMPTMRLDRSLVEKPPHGCPADGRDDAILDGGAGQVRRAPVGHGDTVFNRRPCGQRNNLMLLGRGKKAAVCLDEGGL